MKFFLGITYFLFFLVLILLYVLFTENGNKVIFWSPMYSTSVEINISLLNKHKLEKRIKKKQVIQLPNLELNPHELLLLLSIKNNGNKVLWGDLKVNIEGIGSMYTSIPMLAGNMVEAKLIIIPITKTMSKGLNSTSDISYSWVFLFTK